MSKPIQQLVSEAADIAEQAAAFHQRLIAKDTNPNVAAKLTGDFISGLMTRQAIDRMNDEQKRGEDWRDE